MLFQYAGQIFCGLVVSFVVTGGRKILFKTQVKNLLSYILTYDIIVC